MYLTVIVILLFIFVWLMSFYLLSIWKYFENFIFINILIAIAYFLIIIYGKTWFGNHDEYGLHTIFRIIVAVLIQTCFIFIFTIYKSIQLKKDEKSA